MARVQLSNLDDLLAEVSTDTFKPPVRIGTRLMELSKGKFGLHKEVPEGDSVHESRGGSYIRVGASKRLMFGTDRPRLALRRSQAHFRSFDMKPVPETGFRTLSEVLWKPLRTVEIAIEPEKAHREKLRRGTMNSVTLARPRQVSCCASSIRNSGFRMLASWRPDIEAEIGRLAKSIRRKLLDH